MSLVVAGLKLAEIQMIGLLILLFCGPFVVLAGFVWISYRWQRIVSAVGAICRVWFHFPDFVTASLIGRVCISAPFLAVDVVKSGKPVGQRLVVLQDWSVGMAGSPFTFLVYDDTGQRRVQDDYEEVRIPANLDAYTDEGAQLCVGRSKRFFWRFYLCII